MLDQVKDELWARVRKDQKQALSSGEGGQSHGSPDEPPAYLAGANDHFDKLVGQALEENNPESQISAGYAERLEHRRESAELRREVLYSLLAEANLTGNEDLRPYLYGRIKTFSKDTGVHLQLIEAMDRLPHAQAGAWNTTGTRG